MRKSLIEAFEGNYKKYPERIALVEGERKMSFGELAGSSKVFATRMIEILNGIKNKPVAVFMPKILELVVSDLAISYSGNIFMNLDVKLPLTRLQNIINIIEPVMFVTTEKYRKILDEINVEYMLINEEDLQQNFDESNNTLLMNRLLEQIDTDPLCIINTSGSTGTPKGVVLNNRSFFDFYDWADETFDFSQETIIGSLSPAVFDIYDFELSLLMLKGARMVLLDAGMAIFPIRLLEALRDNEVSYIFWVPTIMVNIANLGLLEKVDLSCLRLVWFAGEVFPTKQFNYWRRQLKDAVFANLYGPIEITLDCTYFIISDEYPEEQPLPIGFPCRNTDILILNEDGNRCEVDEIGELCVRGSSLAMGYYNNPEKTQAAFVQNPLNTSYPELIYRTGDLACMNDEGVILFKGRKDSLIKHMGYRIELGEIEHIVVNVLKCVSNCCVVYNVGQKEITLVYESSEDVSELEIRKKLASQVPRYMIPTKYRQLDEMPRNTNGKIDRLMISNMINEGK